MEKLEIMARVERQKNGRLVAVFPYNVGLDGAVCVFNGEHSFADWSWIMRHTKVANEQQVTELLGIMEKFGYKIDEIKVIKKRNYDKYLREFYKLMKVK